MALTPWDIAQDYINNLNQTTAELRRTKQYGQNAIYRSMIERQDADTAYGRRIALRDQLYQEQQARDAQLHQYRLDEAAARRAAGTDGGAAGSKSRFANPNPEVTYRGPDVTIDPQTTSTGGGEPDMSPQGVYQYYTSQGVSPIIASAIIGNIDAETSFDSNVFAGLRRGDQGQAGFAGQWTAKRLQNLENFAYGRGHKQPTFRDQLDFFMHEGVSGQDPGAKRALELASQSKTPEEAAKWFMMYYERPSVDRAQQARREQSARQIYEQFGGKAAAPSSGRRYPDTVYGPDTGAPAQVPFTNEPDQQTIEDKEHTWTDAELKQYLSSDEIAAIKTKGMEVVGPPRIYSENAFQLLPSEISSNLFPVYKKEQYGPTEYLYMRPAQPEVTQDGVDEQGGAQVTAAPPVEIKHPADQVKGTENVRVVNGQYQMLIDGKWVPMSEEKQ